jgi:hypothetical protein
VRVPVHAGDDARRLAARVLELEHQLLPAAVLTAAAAGRPVPFELGAVSQKLGSKLQAPDSRLLAPSSRILAPDS